MKPTAFISSTHEDLKLYRDAAIEVCLSTGIFPIAMEYFEAMDAGATEGSKRKLKEANLYIGIFAHRYGYIETGYDKSVTEIEFDYAGELNLPRLCFLVDPDYPWPVDKIDHENYERLEEFKARLEKTLIRARFTTVDNFDKELSRALVEWLRKNIQSIHPRRTTVIAPGDAVTENSITIDEIEYPREWKRPVEAGPKRWEKAIGRRREIEQLRQQLQPSVYPKSTALAGMSGAGKSTLASMFVHQYDDTYPGGVLWAELGPQVRRTDPRIQEILDRWAVFAFGGDPAVERDVLSKRYHFTPAAVKRLLSGHGLMLIVLDDIWEEIDTVELLREAVPDESHVLVTTRDVRIAEPFGLVPLDVLSSDDALELVHSRLPNLPKESLRRLAHGLGYHAQALDIASGDIHLRGSLERQENAIDQLLDRVREGAGFDLPQPDQVHHENLVQIALEFSYEDIGRASNGQEFQRRFRYLGTFAPPEANFNATAAALLWDEDPVAAADFLDVLCDRSLLTQRSETRWMQHAILRSFALSLLVRQKEDTDAQQRHVTYYLKQADDGHILEEDLSQVQHAFVEADNETRIRIFERLIPNIYAVAPVWSTARSLLGKLIEGRQYDVLDGLALSPDSTRRELVSSALRQYYPDPDHQSALHAKLIKWLANSNDTRSGSLQIAANAAIAFEVEDVLKFMLTDSRAMSREYVVQDIYRLWTNNATLTRNLLTSLADQINLSDVLKGRRELLDILFRCSLIIVLQDYYHAGSHTNAVAEIRAIWIPLIRRLSLVSRVGPFEGLMRHFRRWGLAWKVIPNVMQMIHDLEGKGQLLYKYEDLESFFVSKERPWAIFKRLVPHIDAIMGSAPESFSDLLAYIEGLSLEDEDLLTVGLVSVVIVSHLHRDPVATAQALRDLAHRLTERYQHTTNPRQPTAGIWVTVMVEVFVTLDFTTLEPHVAETILDALIEISYLYEEYFWDAWRFKSGATIRLAGLDDTLFGYALGDPVHGSQALEKFLRLLVDRDDFDQIKRSVIAICDSMSFFNLPHAGVNALCDTLVLLREYIAALDDTRRAQFWTEFADKLVLYAGRYPEHLARFEEMLDEETLPASVRRHIIGAVVQEDVGYSQLIAFSHFAIKALSDENPFTRDLIRWALQQALRAPSLREWLLDCVVHLANLLYGSELVAEGKR